MTEPAEVLRAFGLGEEDLEAWRAAALPDEAFEDWLTDRVARRPSGETRVYPPSLNYHTRQILSWSVIPAPLTDAQASTVRRLSVEAFRAVDGAGMSRVDFLMDPKTRKIYLNEINTMPGFTSISMYPKLWAASGLPYPDLIERLIQLGLERHSDKKKNQYSR